MIVYVVRGAVAKDALNHIKKGDTVWLGWTDEAGGWFNWYDGMGRAKLFNTPEEARKAAHNCNGPWYSVPSKASIEVLRANYFPSVAARLELA
jgi:hypothetical protein